MGCACDARATCTDPVVDDVTGPTLGHVVAGYHQAVVGSGFTASSVVCVGGVSAEIESRTSTQINFIVPYLGQDSIEEVEVQVCNGSCSASVTSTYESAL